MDLPQQKQEGQYSFPYHHTVSINPFHLAKHLWWGHVYASYIELIVQKLKKKESEFSSITDVGCGDGRLVAELVNCFPEKKVNGIDYSEQSLRFARAFAPQANFSRDFQEKTDAFTLVEVLEHIPVDETDIFLKNIHEHLNDGGWGIITVPHKNTLLNPKHYQHFTEETLTKTLGNFFLIQELQHLNAENILSSILRRVFSNSLFILNSRPLLDLLFSVYKNHCLHAKSENASRLLVLVKKK